MPSNTAHGYPYPVGTDLVNQGDDTLHSLASAVDGQLGVSASGQVSITISAVNTPNSVSVTFPAGRFNAPPSVQTCNQGNTPQNVAVAVQTVTATSVLIWGCRTGGSIQPMNVFWIAIQV